MKTLTPEECRVARALLCWTQRDLATKAALAVSTVADFERGVRQPTEHSLACMEGALAYAWCSTQRGGQIINRVRRILKKQRETRGL